MKNQNLLLACLGAAILASCAKENTVSKAELPSAEKAQITFSVSNSGTKATDDMKDSDVKSIQIFVFRSGANDISGAIDAQSAKTTGTSVSLECTLGTRTIVAVVNGPDGLSFGNLSELSSTISALKDNAKGSFVMVGQLSKDLGSEDRSITVKVKRLAAKVVLSKLTFAFSQQYYTDLLNRGQVVLKRVDLLNVADGVPYIASSAYTPGFFNAGGYKASDGIDAFAHDALSVTASASPYTTAHSLYCYPNATTTKTGISIVVEIAGNLSYYTKYFDNIESNKVYTYTNLTITRPGSPIEGEETLTGTIDFNVEVSEWETGGTYDERI